MNRRGLRVQVSDGPAPFGDGRVYYWRIVSTSGSEEDRDYAGSATEAEARAAGAEALERLLHQEHSDWRD